jgi:predicted membrane GTPase involved in stress response
MTVSKHFLTDRADRYAFIATTIGIGTVVHTYRQSFSKYGDEPCTVNITNTGVAIIKNDKGMVVTMYVITLKEAQKYFINNTIPLILNAIIKRNMRNNYHLLQNTMKY